MNIAMNLKGTVYAIALTCALAVGCAESPSAESPSDEMSTLKASSATTSNTGVVTWGTYEDAEGRWVVGLAADGEKVGTLRADEIDDDTRRFVGQPGGEQVQLSRDGKITGGEGSLAYRLVAALYADTRNAWFSRPGEESASTTGTVTQAVISLNSEQVYTCNGLWGGTCGDNDVGHHCTAERFRSHFATEEPVGDGNCWINRWTTDDPVDCRVNLHLATNWFGKVECMVRTYAYRP